MAPRRHEDVSNKPRGTRVELNGRRDLRRIVPATGADGLQHSGVVDEQGVAGVGRSMHREGTDMLPRFRPAFASILTAMPGNAALVPEGGLA